jgi:hypothetical protein
MTHPIYTQQQLQRKTLNQLKTIYAQLDTKTEVSDKRCKESWVNAIITHQSTKLQKVDNQALAQAELDNYIADQAQTIAPEPLRIVEISFGDHEYYAGNQLIASISYDDNHLTQRWVVIVNDKEVFRANTPMRCDRFICTHYKDGSLPVQEKEATPSTTENQIMAHIFNECQNYNNSQFASRNSQLNAITKSEKPYTCDDSIINSLDNCELRTANCELFSNWWVKRRYSVQQQYSNSVLDAVRSLSMVDRSLAEPVHKYLQSRPLEQLSSNELQQLFNHEVRSLLQELVTV